MRKRCQRRQAISSGHSSKAASSSQGQSSVPTAWAMVSSSGGIQDSSAGYSSAGSHNDGGEGLSYRKDSSARLGHEPL